MSLPKISITNPVFGWMSTLAIFLFGYLSLQQMGVSQYPDVDYPYVSVSVSYPGTAPELVETDVVEPLESALSTVEGVKRISSKAQYGRGSVSLEFDIDKNIDAAIQDVNSVVSSVVRRLPKDIDSPVIHKMNPEDRPILWIALSGKGTLRDLMNISEKMVYDRFATVDGVGEVSLGGFLEPVIRVWLDPNKLSTYDLTYEDVVSSIASEHQEVPAGQMIRSKDELGLRFYGEARTLDDIANLNILKRSGSLLYKKIKLSDVASVESGLEDQRHLARSNSMLSVGYGITKQRGANAVEVAKKLRERMNDIKLPEGYKLELRFDSTEAIKKSVHELEITLLISVLLTSLVCWLFLGSLVSTFNILIAIPTSLMGTFIVMNYLGLTLNSFTMLALILSVGLVVDDAIMVLENVFRHRKTNHHPKSSALSGTEQVQFAAVATTLAIIAIFIPITYVSGVLGKYLAQFGIVLCVAVSISTFEALTFTPMRLSLFRGKEVLSGIPKYFDLGVQNLASKYGEFVSKIFSFSIKKSLVIYLVAISVLLLSVILIVRVPTEMLPKEESDSLTINAELPLGTSMSETSRRMEEVEKILAAQDGIASTYLVIGFGGVNSGRLMVSLEDKKHRKVSQDDIEEQLREKFKKLGRDFKIRIQSFAGGALGARKGFPIDINLQGPNWEELVQASKHLADVMSKDKMFTDVDTSFDDGSPELAIIPNRQAALEYGVSVGAISETISFLFNGVTAAKFNEQGKRVEIIVKTRMNKIPQTIDELKKMFVRNGKGQLIPLGSVVEIQDAKAPVSISREDRLRTIGVRANIAKGFFAGEAMKRAGQIARDVLPKTIVINDKIGSAGEMQNTFKDLIFALILGVVVAYMILGSQFNSFSHPFTILLALPFSVSGAFAALWLTNSTLNLYSMIGLLLLMGIVKKNSIMLVEFANQGVKSGMIAEGAMIDACKTRFRPILMTAFTTMASALPPALKIGTDTVASSSMAISIIGGVLVSTLLTFFIVPLAYVHFARFKRDA